MTLHFAPGAGTLFLVVLALGFIIKGITMWAKYPVDYRLVAIWWIILGALLLLGL